MEGNAFTIFLIIVISVFSYLGFRRRDFIDRFIFSPYAVLAYKQYFRLISSAFLHANWKHLGMNIICLYIFGTQLENSCGVLFFYSIFFSSVLGGTLLSLWLHRNHEYLALGASGGVCGVMYANLFCFPGSSVNFLPGSVFVVAFLAVSIFGLYRSRDNIGHDAHIGGAMIGLIVMAVIRPSIIVANPISFSIAMIISGLLFVHLYRTKGILLPMNYFQMETIVGLFSKMTAWRTTRHESRHDEQIDRILAKISHEGMEKLSKSEKRILDSASKKHR